MIEEQMLERYRKLDTSLVSDALEELGIPGGLLGIEPIVPGIKLCGEAFTVRYIPRGLEEAAVGDYLKDVARGEVIVVENGGRLDYAIWGDITTRIGKKRGLGGVVIDGACRDIEAVRETGFPVFARGKSMVSGKRHLKAEQTQVPVNVAGMRVCPGDLIFGDETGVIAIPRPYLQEVLEKGEQIQRQEAAFLATL